MSINPFAALVQVAARSAIAGLEGVSNKPADPKAAKKKGSNCTPCAAMARREAAQRMVKGG